MKIEGTTRSTFKRIAMSVKDRPLGHPRPIENTPEGIKGNQSIGQQMLSKFSSKKRLFDKEPIILKGMDFEVRNFLIFLSLL